MPIPGLPGSQPPTGLPQSPNPGQPLTGQLGMPHGEGFPASVQTPQSLTGPQQDPQSGSPWSPPPLTGRSGPTAPGAQHPSVQDPARMPAGQPNTQPTAPSSGTPPHGGMPPALPGGPPRPSAFQGYQPPNNQEPFGQLIHRDTPGQQAPTRQSGEIAGLPEKTGFAVPTNTTDISRPGAPQVPSQLPSAPPPPAPSANGPARQIGGPTAQPWPPIPTNQPPADQLPHPQLPPSHPRNSPGVSYTHLQAFPGPRTGGPPLAPPGSIRNPMQAEMEERPAPLPSAQAAPGTPGAVYTSLPAMQPGPAADSGQKPTGYIPPQPTQELFPQQQAGYAMGQMPPQAMPGALGSGTAPPAVQPMGYPRPYAAGHPMAAQDAPSAAGQAMQQQRPAMPAPNMIPTPQPGPQMPVPTQAPQATPLSAPPSVPQQPPYQSGFQAAANAHAQRMASAPEVKQPETWDPSADYDEEDDIAGDL